MNFVWVHRHYNFEGRRVRVTRTFGDVIVIQEVRAFTEGPLQNVDRKLFSETAILIDEVP